MDFLRPRAVPALGALLFALAFPARADCGGVNGFYADDSVEKVDGSPVTLSSFAALRDRSKLVKREDAGGAKPAFGGSGQVMARPKSVKLVGTVELRYAVELDLRFFDKEGKLLVQSQSLTPTRWKCVSGRLERKYQMARGLGEVMQTEDVEQVMMAAPGGDLVFIETTTIAGKKGEPKRTEVHFKRVPKPSA